MDWLSSHWQEVLSLLGILLTGLTYSLYVRTIFSGESKPHRVTWGGWTLVGVLGLVSSNDGGAGIGLLVTLAFVLGIAVIFCLSLNPKYGKPGGTRAQFVAGVIAAMALLSIVVVNYPPELGATIAIVADLVFLWPTLKAAWLQPDTEALYPWVMGAVAESMGVLALGTYTYAAAGYSVYILCGNLAVITALVIQKPKHAVKKAKSRSS